MALCRSPRKLRCRVGRKVDSNSYFRMVKALIISILALFFTFDVAAQVIFRNDFIINRKQKKLENLGITTITVNLDRQANYNQLVNGRGGRSLVIDVRALRNRTVSYTYAELAERVYTPTVYTGPVVRPVPGFLLSSGPDIRRFNYIGLIRIWTLRNFRGVN